MGTCTPDTLRGRGGGSPSRPGQQPLAAAEGGTLADGVEVGIDVAVVSVEAAEAGSSALGLLASLFEGIFS